MRNFEVTSWEADTCYSYRTFEGSNNQKHPQAKFKPHNQNCCQTKETRRDSTCPEFPGAQISVLRWPVSASKTLTWAPYSCSTVPRNDSRGFLSASDNRRKKKNLLLLISSKIHSASPPGPQGGQCRAVFPYEVTGWSPFTVV